MNLYSASNEGVPPWSVPCKRQYIMSSSRKAVHCCIHLFADVSNSDDVYVLQVPPGTHDPITTHSLWFWKVRLLSIDDASFPSTPHTTHRCSRLLHRPVCYAVSCCIIQVSCGYATCARDSYRCTFFCNFHCAVPVWHFLLTYAFDSYTSPPPSRSLFDFYFWKSGNAVTSFKEGLTTLTASTSTNTVQSKFHLV